MSLTNKKVVNPVKKYISYNASEGVFQYYDKTKKENVKIDNPVQFIDVAQYSTIVGWNDEKQSSIFSNEVLSVKTPLNVRFQKGGSMVNGIYSEIKDTIKANGGKFAVSVYAIINEEVVKILLKGASLSAWFNRPAGDIISVNKFAEEKKGATVYKVPVFEGKEITEAEEEQIRDKYKDLFAYLEAKDKNQVEEEVEKDESVQEIPDEAIPTINIEEEDEIKIEDVPF